MALFQVGRHSRLRSLQISLDRHLNHMRRRSRAVALSQNRPHEIEAEVGTLVINLANYWSAAARSYLVSCSLGAKTTTGRQVVSALPLNSEDDFLKVAIQARGRRNATPNAMGKWNRRDEPAWHDTSVIIDVAAAASLSNTASIQSAFGFGFSVFGHLPTFRNYFAHRGFQTRQAAMAFGPLYAIGTSAKPSEVMRYVRSGASSSVLESWIDEIQLTIDELCR